MTPERLRGIYEILSGSAAARSCQQTTAWNGEVFVLTPHVQTLDCFPKLVNAFYETVPSPRAPGVFRAACLFFVTRAVALVFRSRHPRVLYECLAAVAGEYAL